ncbi:MAG: hypothetical protein FWF76_03900 [Oscillospiraceae bacterium]|nr:hypothetical protein [Oscillospiraceae bacterium]
MKNTIVKLIIWFVIYVGYVFMAYEIAIVNIKMNFHEFFEGHLFDVQKYFLDVSFFFTVYLFILKKPFTSTSFVSRCKELYLFHVVFYGIKICIMYIFVTLFLFLGASVLGGLYLQIDTRFIFNILNLFAFLFFTYLVYLLFLIKTEKQNLSLIVGYSINLLILSLYHATSLVSENIFSMIELLVLNTYSVASIVMILFITVIYRRKEFLS